MRAAVIGASGGIGAAVAAELEARGVDVMRVSRSGDGLDITNEASVAEAVAGLPDDLDLVFVATGALVSTRTRPEKALAQLEPEEFVAQMRLNAIGPALVLKHLRIPRRGRFVFAALSARVGSIGDNRLGGWYSYRASKAALNALIHGAAIEIGRSHKEAVVVCLHPGTVSTAFTEEYPDHDKITPEDAAARLMDVLERLGPEQSGGFYDYAGEEIEW